MKIYSLLPLALLAILVGIPVPSALSQGIFDGVIVSGILKDGPQGSLGPGIHTALVTYNRKLQVSNILDVPQYGDTSWGVESNAGIGIARNGDLFIRRVCNLTCHKAVRISPSGQVVWEANIADVNHISSYGARDFAVDRDDNLYVEIADNSGKLSIRKILANGTIEWTNSSVSNELSSGTPSFFYLTSDQTLWCAGQTFVGSVSSGKLVGVSPVTGSVLSQQTFPKVGTSQYGSGVNGAAARPSGLHWVDTTGATVTPPSGFRKTHRVVYTGAITTISSFDFNGEFERMCVGADDSVYFLNSPPGGSYQKLARLNVETGVPDKFISIGQGVGPIYNLSNNSEEAFFIGGVLGPSGEPEIRLIKLSLVTGQSSFVVVSGLLKNPKFVRGDSTGQLMATIIDQDGDNDGDGYTNYREVRFGYNPYDATNYPTGPKIYLWFDEANNSALNIKIYDPDGINDAAGGIQMSTLLVRAEHPQLGSGDILPALLPYLTNSTTSNDGTTLTLTFGGYAFPKDLGFGLTVSVSDVLGAFAWDWHMTPQTP
ncbi:MAG: hypothetical protein ACKVS6_15075 [Planctomycetota bacterium]